MTKGKNVAAWAEAQIGTPYKKMDCMDLVTEAIRHADGADGESLTYRCAGCNALWRSLNASGKYRYVTKRLGIETAKAMGAIRPGALLVIWEPGYNDKYDDDEGNCSHIGIYVGNADCEVVHSSQSREKVCASTLKNGWTHVLVHRLIDLEDGEVADIGYTPLDAPYTAIVCTQKDPLNIREKPEAKGRIIAKVKKGAEVTVVGEAEADGNGCAWLPVEVHGGLTAGWACAQYLTNPQQADTENGARDMVCVPRGEILALADALATMDDSEAFNAAKFFDGVDSLQKAAQDITARLKGDD